jgi:hypothetical protein
MFTISPRWVTAAAVGAALTVGLAGCSETIDGHGAASVAASSTTSTGFPSTTSEAPTSSSATGTGSLSKQQFVTTMNHTCSKINAQFAALPVPSSADDNQAIRDLLALGLKLYPPYIAQAKRLAVQTDDAEELQSNWLTPEEADFNTEKPVLVALISAIDAKDATKVQRLEAQLDAMPDHTDAIAEFMTTYGLTDCADLESG